MNRLFGTKNTAPKPTLQGAISSLDSRVESIDVKLAKLNAELSTYQQRMAKMRDGPGKSALKQKALKVLQQRKMYEGQREQLQQQGWNMEQAGMMQDNLKNVMVTVDALKTTNKELKMQYGKINLDKIEQLQDEMADLMDLGNEIQESISRSYNVPDDVDEAELDAELEALSEEMELSGGWETEVGGSDSLPAFLQEEEPSVLEEGKGGREQEQKVAAG
ncbi:Snf7-domain-containing protein [Terfezia claveryi]|nr:Snf7-domain-containing protein [Terfezia claveryi]